MNGASLHATLPLVSATKAEPPRFMAPPCTMTTKFSRQAAPFAYFARSVRAMRKGESSPDVKFVCQG